MARRSTLAISLALLFLPAMLLADETRLPTGMMLDPASASRPLGNFPLAMAMAPDGKEAVVVLSGWREQGIEVIDLNTMNVVQKIAQPAAFVGLAFSPDGHTLFASGGNEDTVVRYRWRDDRATPDGTIRLSSKGRAKYGTRYPAGLAFSPDGKRLYVAENLGDSLAVIDIEAGAVVQRVETDRYPYGVAVAPDGEVFVSSWGDDTVISYKPNARGFLKRQRRIQTVRHPAAMLLDAEGGRLYVTSPGTDRIGVVDIHDGKTVSTLVDAAPAGPSEGMTPDALALSRDGSRLFVAEADANCVAVFALDQKTSGRKGSSGRDDVVGRIPVEWYPSAIALRGGNLVVTNAKGRGTAPNPRHAQPNQASPKGSKDFTLGQIRGSIMTVPIPGDATALASFTARVAAANGWNARKASNPYPPFKHVIYIIKENRTYDQVFGDMKEGDGDPSLVFFGRANTPNHHALAKRFGLFDRFFTNAEVSADGHNWSTAAYATDYVQKTVPSEYSQRRSDYDYEGTNRGRIVDEDDDVAAPAMGYIWDAAIRKGVSVRDYGEFVWNGPRSSPEEGGAGRASHFPTRHALMGRVNLDYPPYDLDISDQVRATVWLDDLAKFTKAGSMPALQVVRLPNDHTSGGTPGRPTPRAYAADNDLALGRIVEGLSKSPFWKDTVVFVLEDDAQNGPDHVDSHRAPMLVVSAWNKGGVWNRFVNTTDVLATIEQILGLDALSQFDYHSRPLREIFADKPDLRPYEALKPGVSLDERNPPKTEAAKESAKLDLDHCDAANEDAFNRILWRMIKGPTTPYPGPTRQPAGTAWSR